jgi:hypothetical protein
MTHETPNPKTNKATTARSVYMITPPLTDKFAPAPDIAPAAVRRAAFSLSEHHRGVTVRRSEPLGGFAP